MQLALALILDDLFSALVKDSFIKFNYKDCIAVNSLYYYTFMVVQMWTGAEALLLLQKLIFVFKETTTRFIITVSLVCWGEYKGIHVVAAVFFAYGQLALNVSFTIKDHYIWY